MQFNIKCATFVRIAQICGFFEHDLAEETREKINTVRLEISNGKVFAIATNVKIAAIEFIGHTSEKNGVAHVVIDQDIIDKCNAEIWFDGMLTINTIPEMAIANASTSTGWTYSKNACHWFDETPLDNWREWAPDNKVLTTDGVMYWNLFHIETLVKSSPSGKIIFPRYIDTKYPIVLRDRENPAWVGLFVPSPDDRDAPVEQAADLPDWWRA